MLGQLQFADARPIGDADDRGLIPHRMHVPGCRVQLRQKEIAEQLGCSEERVRLAIKQMRICGIIVNDGHGWYEFDATFFWKGKEQFRLAYLSIQDDLKRIEFVC